MKLIQIACSIESIRTFERALRTHIEHNPNDTVAISLHSMVKETILAEELAELMDMFLADEIETHRHENCADCPSKDVCNPPSNTKIN